MRLGLDTGGQHRIALRRQRLGAVGLRYTDVADQHGGTAPEKMKLSLQSCDQFRNGFSGGSWRVDRPARRSRQETARFPRARPATAPTPAPSVSHILRRNARSRVRLTERALSLKQRASDRSLQSQLICAGNRP